MHEETQPSAEDSRRPIPEQEDTTNSDDQPSNRDMWKVRKERARQDLLDPRLQKYSEIFPTESLVERLSGRNRLSLVLDLDLTLLETISEDNCAVFRSNSQWKLKRVRRSYLHRTEPNAANGSSGAFVSLAVLLRH